MCSRGIIDDYRSINEPSVIRVMIVSDTTTWSVTYDCHSDDRNIFIIQTTVLIWVHKQSLLRFDERK